MVKVLVSVSESGKDKSTTVTFLVSFFFFFFYLTTYGLDTFFFVVFFLNLLIRNPPLFVFVSAYPCNFRNGNAVPALDIVSIIVLSVPFFSKRSILVTVADDPGSIPGTLCVSREYTRDGTPVCRMIPCTHTHTRSQTRGPSNIANPIQSNLKQREMWGNKRTQRKPNQTLGEDLKFHADKSSGSSAGAVRKRHSPLYRHVNTILFV